MTNWQRRPYGIFLQRHLWDCWGGFIFRNILFIRFFSEVYNYHWPLLCFFDVVSIEWNNNHDNINTAIHASSIQIHMIWILYFCDGLKFENGSCTNNIKSCKQHCRDWGRRPLNHSPTHGDTFRLLPIPTNPFRILPTLADACRPLPPPAMLQTTASMFSRWNENCKRLC